MHLLSQSFMQSAESQELILIGVGLLMLVGISVLFRKADLLGSD